MPVVNNLAGDNRYVLVRRQLGIGVRAKNQKRQNKLLDT
jgi:hypothetical protein